MTFLLLLLAFWFTFLVGTGFGVWLHAWMADVAVEDAVAERERPSR